MSSGVHATGEVRLREQRSVQSHKAAYCTAGLSSRAPIMKELAAKEKGQ